MPVDLDISNAVAYITLNRPDVLNAFDDALGAELLSALEKTTTDRSVRCIVVTGAGRAFCAGEDLAAYRSGDAPDLGDTLRRRYNPIIRAIRLAPQPVVAGLNGVAAGAGASLALACDFRIASERAQIVLAFIKVGLVPDSGAVWFLARMVGTAKALELSSLGDPITGDEGLRLGVVNQVAPAAEFDDALRSFAERLAAGPTHAYSLTKSLTNRTFDLALDAQLDLEAEMQSEAGETSDHREGIAAFFDKRRPEFKGE
jgi:2-(1,2-epoxy-1,2-dihydrophenyl)acetyl-CoA isomerase